VNSGTDILNILITVLSIGILGRVVISFLDPFARNSISRVIYDLTEPIVGPIRRLIPPLGGTLDLSPLIALVLLQVLREVVNRAL
jgi:YggT family protein